MTQLDTHLTTDAYRPAMKPGRLLMLDGARGYLLVMMFMGHMTMLHWTPLDWFHHGRLSAVMDAEFFIPLSGFVCALSYASVFLRSGFFGSERAILKRLRWLYVYQVAVSVLVLLLSLSMWSFSSSGIQSQASEVPFGIQVLQSLTFARQPMFLDILLVYMVLMTFIPVAQKLLFANRVGVYFAILAGCWLFSRLGLDDRVLNLFYTRVADTRPYFSLAGNFNPLSYAILFYGGFYLGHLFKKEGAAHFREHVLPVSFRYFRLALLVIAIFAIADMIPNMPDSICNPPRERLTELAIVNILAIAYAVYFLVNARDLSGVLMSFRKAVVWVLSLPVLRMIGQNSLFFYSAHVVIVYLVHYWIVGLHLEQEVIAKMCIQLGAVACLIPVTRAKQRHLPALP